MSSPDVVAKAQADFAFHLLRKILEEEETPSVIFSPISVSLALAVVLAGAKGESEEELRAILGGAASTDEIHRHFSAVVRSFNRLTSDRVTLQIANRAYVKTGYKIFDSFRNFVNDTYVGGFESVDFNNAAGSVKTINNFVSEVTRGKIPNILTTDQIHHLTRLIIVNAVYFKGTWRNQFSKNETKLELFYASPNSKREVEMMNATKFFHYYENDRLKCLRLDYSAGDVRAYFVLPQKRHGLVELLGLLTGRQFLTEVLPNETYEKVEVKLPKFRIESTHKVDDLLKTLDVKNIFSVNKADFTGITDDPEKLYVESIVQKAAIEVDEAGSEAAAATAVLCNVMCCQKQPKLHQFHADQPFVFLLAIDQNILFTGYVLKC